MNLKNISDLPTPCHVIDLDKLRSNLEYSIKRIREESNCNVLLAIKGFSADTILPLMREGLDGVSASSAFEARFGNESVGKYVCTFSPSYQEHNIKEVVKYSDAVIFNSEEQFISYNKIAYEKGCSCGIRINPEYSGLPKDFAPDPCQPYSRLGIISERMPSISMFDKGKIEGIHLHNMCEQNVDVLEKTVSILQDKFDPYLKRIKWLNLGGGQMYAKDGYDLSRAIKCFQSIHERYDVDIYLEPCAGIMVGCGYYIVTVIDIIENVKNIAIVDGSGICHMIDSVYRGWRRDISGAGEADVHPYAYQLAGSSCYAGDIWGDYSFPNPLKPGDRIVFEDTAAYSMVKNNTFNGIQRPSLAVYNKAEGLIIKKQYDYEGFIKCL